MFFQLIPYQMSQIYLNFDENSYRLFVSLRYLPQVIILTNDFTLYFDYMLRIEQYYSQQFQQQQEFKINKSMRNTTKRMRMSIEDKIRNTDYDEALFHQQSSPQPLQNVYRRNNKKSKFMNKASSLVPIMSNQMHYLKTHENDEQLIVKNPRNSKRYKSNTNQVDDEDFLSQKQKYRITFNRYPEVKSYTQSKQYSRIPQRTPIKDIQRPQRGRIRQKSSQLKNLLMQSQNKIGSQKLKQVVGDLQQHNKNIMEQAKSTIQDFEQYIQSLLQSNAELQSILLEYEEYINQLQNEKLSLIQNQKSREQEFEKIVVEKIKTQKQLKLLQAKIIQKQKEKPIQKPMQVEKLYKKQDFDRLKQQLQNKERTIKMLEQAICDKENNIRKMSNFNNQMCLEIMELKSKKYEEVRKVVSQLEQQNSLRKKMQKKQDAIAGLRKQNENLHKINQELQEQIKQLIQDDEMLLNHVKKQSRKMQIQEQSRNKLQKRLEMYNKITQMAQFSPFMKQIDQSLSLESAQARRRKVKTEQSGPIENKQTTFRIKQKQSQDKINQNQSSISSISKKDQQALFKNYNIFIQMEENPAVLKKVKNLLKVAYKLLKSSNKNQKLKQTINRLIKMMNQIGTLGVQDGEISENRSETNFLTYLQEEENLQPRSFKNIMEKNEQMLSRISKIRKRIKEHTLHPTQQSRESDPLYRYKDSTAQFVYSEQFYPSYGFGKNSETTKSCDILGLSKDMTKSLEKDNQLYGSMKSKL